MKVIVHYIVSIQLGGFSGKEKATTDKVNQLKQQARLFRVFSLSKLPSQRFLKALSMAWFDLKYLIMLVTGRVEKPDVIFTRTVFSLGSHLAGQLYKIPVVREVHADFLEEAKILFAGRPVLLWLSKIQALCSQFFLRRSAGLIFNHPLLQRYYEDELNFVTPSISVYNGADTDGFYPISTAESLDRLGLSTDKKYLLFLGSVSPWHGVEYVLETFLRLQAYRDDTELLIVGGTNIGVAKDILNRYSGSPNVRFTGRVNNTDAMYYINAATACLLPVKNQRVSPGSPIKLFDYIACGKPVISQGNTIGYSDLVEKYDLGVCCDFTNSNQAAQTIDGFLDEFDAEYYRSHNRHVAETELNWSATICAWLTFAGELQRGM